MASCQSERAAADDRVAAGGRRRSLLVWLLALLVLGTVLVGGANGEPQGGDWNALSGMWGKRASDWNRLSGMWGKRGPYGPYQALVLRAGESGEGAGHGISARAAGPAALRENHWNDLSGYWG